jgi:hypothetical protein
LVLAFPVLCSLVAVYLHGGAGSGKRQLLPPDKKCLDEIFERPPRRGLSVCDVFNLRMFVQLQHHRVASWLANPNGNLRN